MRNTCLDKFIFKNKTDWQVENKMHIISCKNVYIQVSSMNDEELQLGAAQFGPHSSWEKKIMILVPFWALNPF